MRTYHCKRNIDHFLVEVSEIIATGELEFANLSVDTVEAYNGKRLVAGNTVTQERIVHGVGTPERYTIEAKSVYEDDEVILSLKSFNKNTLRYVKLSTKEYDDWNPLPMHQLLAMYENNIGQTSEVKKEAGKQSLEIVNRLDTVLSIVRGMIDKNFLTSLAECTDVGIATGKDIYGVSTSRVLSGNSKVLRIDVSLGFDHSKEKLDICIEEFE